MGIQGELVGKYIAGCDVPIKDLNIIISQPTVKSILQFGEDNFFGALNFLTQLKTILDKMIKEVPGQKFLSEFHFFLSIYHEEPTMRSQINDFFTLVFPIYNVKVTENSIDFIDIEENTIKGRINPFNFELLQKVISELFLPYTNKKEEYNPGSEAAAAIAEKIRRGKEKISKQKNEQDVSLFGSYLSILAIGLKIDINILMSYTPFQLYDAFTRYMMKSTYDNYVKLSTIPFADASKLEEPDNWTDNIYK